jgi:uncharacterized membrane protein YoaK (UPF0700 family)
MFHHNSRENYTLRASLHWMLLAFTAGNINAGGFLACRRFVSHVTGFGTLFGIDAANNRWDAAIGILSVPIFFLMGSVFAASLVDARVLKGQRPRFALVMALVTFCLILAAVLGHSGMFGHFGEEVRLRRDYFFLALLCAASGLMNATITLTSDFTVRVTHMTGTTTDLGIAIARTLAPGTTRRQRVEDMKAIWLKVGSIGAFAFGSAIGAILFLQAKYLGFLLPAAISAYTVFVARGEERWIAEHCPVPETEPVRLRRG